MARLNLTRPRTLGIGLAVVSLALAACSKSPGTTPLPGSSSTPTPAPTISGLPSSLSSPCANTVGIAYEPDAGNGGTFKGIQITHFEDSSQNLCSATAAPNAFPPGVAFVSAVGPLAFSPDRSDAIAVLQNASGNYTLAQDIFGSLAGAIVPVGPTYDLGLNPTPVPTASSSASPSATTSPAVVPLLADVNSVAIIGSGIGGIALSAGMAAPGSSDAITALTSLANAPPQYGQAVPFSGSNYTLKSIPANPRSIVRVGNDTTKIVALVRGPQDLLSFAVTTIGSGYQFDAMAVDSTLGSNTTLRGSGAIAIDPADAGRALVGGTTSGAGSTLTLVTGLPGKIVKASTLAMPGNIRSIAISNAGLIGVVGTDAGIVVVKGTDTGTLAVVMPIVPSATSSLASTPSYRTCTGTTSPLSSIYSVAFSGDQRFLVALGTTPGVTCASGYNASIVAVAFNATNGTTPTPTPAPSTTTATPAPTMFVQNNVIAPPAGADYFFAF